MRKLQPVLWAILLIALASLGVQAQRVIVMPGANSSSQQLTLYTPVPLSYVVNSNVSAGAFQALSNLNATRYFVISNSGSGYALNVIDNSGSIVQGPIAFGQPIVTAAVTPDGKKLLVLSTKLYVYDIQGSSATLLTRDGLAIGTAPVDMAVSVDSSRAFVLSIADQKLWAVDLSTSTVLANPLSLPNVSGGVTQSPNGFLYSGGTGKLYEIDGRGATGPVLRNSFNLPAATTPTKPGCTPDGRYVLTGGSAPQGAALVEYDSQTGGMSHILYWAVLFDRVVAADDNTFYVLSNSPTQTLYSVPVNNINGLAGANFYGAGDFRDVTSVVVSDEVPPQNMYVASDTDRLTHVDLTGRVSAETIPGAGVLAYVAPVSGSMVEAVTGINRGQSVEAGGTTLPMVIRALDVGGRPVAGAGVTWTPPSGMVQVSAMSTTSAQGLAMAWFTAPSSVGTYTVTAAVGGKSMTFNVTVGSGSGTGTGGAGIQIISGQGQVASLPFGSFRDQLTVQVNDANGNPVPSAAVTWNLSGTQGLGHLTGSTTVCNTVSSSYTLTCAADSSGKSTVTLQGDGVIGFVPVATYQITATVASGTVTFYETLLNQSIDGNAVTPTASFQAPTDPDDLMSLYAGQTKPGALKVKVNLGQYALQHVAIVASTGNTPGSGPTAGCAGTWALTDENGIATCDLVAGNTVGTASLQVTAGSMVDVAGSPIPIDILPGQPSQIAIKSGNNQAGSPGQTLAIPLLAQIVDPQGNPIAGISATFTVIPANGGTVSPTTTTSDYMGRMSTRLTLGSGAAGTVQVRVSAGGLTATFTETVNVSITGLDKVSGDGQTATVNTAFGSPLVVQVTPAQAGLGVGFTVASGSATLSPATATTDAQGKASVTVNAGATAGAVQINASVGSKTVTFNLTVSPPAPPLTAASFLNAASFQAGSGVAFGSLVTIMSNGSLTAGLNLAPGNCFSGGSIQPPLPTRVAGVEVQFGGSLAPILAVCRTADNKDQINIQVPFELPPTTLTAIVRTGAGTTSTSEAVVNDLRVVNAFPGIFQYTPAGATQLHGVIMRPDGSVVSPDNKAQRSETLRMYATGLGPTTPFPKTNQPGYPGQNLYFTPVVKVDGTPIGGVTVEYAEHVIGLYVVSFQLPAQGMGSGMKTIELDVVTDTGDIVTGNTTQIAIQ